MYKTKLIFKEYKGTWTIPWYATLDLLATITSQGVFREEINLNEELLLEMWSEALESSMQGPCPYIHWEIYVGTLGTEEDWTLLLKFKDSRLKYS